MSVWRIVKQLVLQPDWSGSDHSFHWSETATLESVASDHGGNEMSVNVSKKAGYISEGFLPNTYPVQFNKA